MKLAAAWILMAGLGAASEIPWIGCEGGGQIHILPRAAKMVRVALEPKVAERLAYYDFRFGLGVLAPRGWNCWGSVGSSGDSLDVGPSVRTSWADEKIAGPSIQIESRFGSTPGRFVVADIIAMFFPSRRRYFESFKADFGYEPERSHPFPDDRLLRKSGELVEFVTPPNSDGLGTMRGLAKNGDPIQGFVRLVGKTPDLVILTVRLPREQSDLVPFIVWQAEQIKTLQ